MKIFSSFSIFSSEFKRLENRSVSFIFTSKDSCFSAFFQSFVDSNFFTKTQSLYFSLKDCFVFSHQYQAQTSFSDATIELAS